MSKHKNPRPMVPIGVRFWSKVAQTGNVFECWDWMGSERVKGQGYGQFATVINGKRKNNAAYRFAYETTIGPIPGGLTIDHLCRNRKCVNPWHLEPVTSTVNTLRSEGPSAKNAVATHCVNGHEFTPENTYGRESRSRGGRVCKTCIFDRKRADRAARKAAGLPYR